MTTLYHYPKCSTCVKARRWLEAHDVAHELIDLVAKPPSKATLKTFLRTTGMSVTKLFNTSGVSYREGGFKDRLAAMTESQALDALAADGRLIKRPILVGDGWVLVGFRESAYADMLVAKP